MKKCEHCGTISQDADVVCGVCGSNIANAPMLTGSIEDEILKDRKSSEEESGLIQQRVARASRQGLVRRLLPSLLAVTFGFGLLLYGLFQALSLGDNSAGVQSPTLLIDILSLIAGFGFIIAGFNFGIKGVTSGASPRERGRNAAVPTPSYEFNTVSNMSMTATYEGQFLPKKQQNEKPSR